MTQHKYRLSTYSYALDELKYSGPSAFDIKLPELRHDFYFLSVSHFSRTIVLNVAELVARLDQPSQ
jgi:hypothetical protein